MKLQTLLIFTSLLANSSSFAWEPASAPPSVRTPTPTPAATPAVTPTAAASAAPVTPKNPPVSHSVKIDDVEFDIVMQAPHLMIAPLQVLGAFTYAGKKDGFSGADFEMDEGFQGLIQDLRKNQGFGHLAEHLLLTPPAGGMIVPAKILVMGLGDASTWKSQDMEQIGRADIREVCALGLSEFSHASDVQDGGVNRENAGVVAEHVLIGMVHELRLQKSLAARSAVPTCHIRKITYLAGPKFLKDTIAALERVKKTI